MRNVAECICGYVYGTGAVATPAVSLQELEDLKTTAPVMMSGIFGWLATRLLTRRKK